jgi:16S rRNA (uracil1498-N3)-methyltransferase
MHRFFITAEDAIRNDTLQLYNEDLISQICRVFRSKVGDKFIFIHEQKEYEGQLLEINKKNLKFSIFEIESESKELSSKLKLYFPLLKSADKIEFILQKCTEIGVVEFNPIITARTERDILPKVARLNKIIVEAAEQSGRSYIPVLNDPINFKNIELASDSSVLILDPRAKESILKIELKDEVNILIGPEGGFNKEEVDLITQNGAKSCSIGSLIYRAETACVVAAGIIANRVG